MTDRRQWLGKTAGLLATGAAMVQIATGQQESLETQDSVSQRQGHIRHSVMGWCFNPMEPVELAKHGKRLGLVAIEGVDSKFYPAIRSLGLDISLVGSHGFAKGPVDKANHAEVEKSLKSAIDTAVQFKSPSVITFTGMRVPGMPDEVAKQNCLDCWRRVIKYAEQQQITLCLEHLNSRDDSHPMKGHPGYFGDDIELCVELIRQMDSSNFKLLFDIYHVQIMHGDVIRRIRQYHSVIGHYHTAGNPGRAELDDQQEINYPPIMRAILETGYRGFVAHEFIPTWPDPIKALDHAIGVCDV
jgi:hydroxypyruvate isomerase